MSHYGIIATHWNVSLGEIDEVEMRKVMQKGEGRFGLAPAELTWCSDVASLIDAGHTVWVIVSNGRGKYTNTDRVSAGIRDGGRRTLFSCAEDGTPTSALSDLPRYIRPDDPLSDSARELLAKSKYSAGDHYPTLTQQVDFE